MKRICLLLSVLLVLPFYALAQQDSTNVKPTDSLATIVPIPQPKETVKKDNKPLDKLSKGELRDSIQKLEMQLLLRDSLLALYKLNSERQDSIQKVAVKKQHEDSLTIEGLNRLLKDSMTAHIVKTFGKECQDADQIFCRFLFESPLYHAYNDTLITHAFEMAKLLGYDQKKNRYHVYYQIYEPLLKNYGGYTEEIADAINAMIRNFNLLPKDKIDRKALKEDYLSREGRFKYLKVKGTGEHPNLRHIAFLDYRLDRLRALFDNDKDFNVENFKKEYKFLTGRDWSPKK